MTKASKFCTSPRRTAMPTASCFSAAPTWWWPETSIDTTRFPVIDLAHGGSIQGEIDALNKLIELAIAPMPFIYKEVGTYVIPGHGRLWEQMDVVDYRDMVVIVRDVIADMIKQGMTLDQMKAAIRPSLMRRSTVRKRVRGRRICLSRPFIRA